MPYFLNLIKYYYWFLTVLIVVVPLRYGILSFLPSLFIMWVAYFCFKSGAKRSYSYMDQAEVCCRINQYPDIYIDKIFICFTCFLLIFIPLYIKFYTGGTIASAILSFGTSTGSDSNYAMYQQYFAVHNLRAFTLDKLPYIVLNGLSKVIFWYFCVFYIAYNQSIKNLNLICFAFIYLLFFFSGVSRGTSFENFELLVITVFCILTSQKTKYGIDTFSKRQLVILGSVIVVAGMYFIFSKSLRFEDYSAVSLAGPTSTLRYDSDSWIMSIAPSVGEAALSFAGYFVFPMYFTSEVFWKIAVGSGVGLLSFLIPFFAPSIYQDSGSYRFTLEKLGVDCGACWNPDVTTFIYYLGLPLFLTVIYYMGKIAGRQYVKGIQNGNIGNILLLFVITYEMFSLPVGNFLVISSANKIALIVIIYLVYTKHFNRFLQR